MANPIIKWAGGKRQLLPELKNNIPKKYNTYFEPFFGGGALFFSLNPSVSIINDSNAQLINMYNQVKNNADDLIKILQEIQNEYNQLSEEEQTDFYYEKRDVFNHYIKENELTLNSASIFIFLNKTAFNGLYRTNAKGLFNVPSAHKRKVNLFDGKNIKEVSKLLKNTKIENNDFETICKTASSGDFVFFDSPYFDTFDTYQANGFSENDHIRLANLFKDLTNKGIYCLATNSNTDYVKELYKDFKINIVQVKRMINADANNRTGTEVIISNRRWMVK